MSQTFFELEQRPDDEWFIPLDAARGPWDPEACHAGPVAALLARAAERALRDHRLVRLTVDLNRAVPHAGFRIEAAVVHAGRTVGTTALTLYDGDDRVAVTARGMHLTPQPERAWPTPASDTPKFFDAVAGDFPFRRSAHDLPSFTAAVTTRFAAGQDADPGPTTAWMKAVRLLPGERMSGFQRICPIADCGNAMSRNSDADDVSFVNTDLTIYVHRTPIGRWFGIQALSRWEADGIGISDALLFDEHGPVGRAVQGLTIRPLA